MESIFDNCNIMQKNATKGFIYIISATILWGMAAPLAKYLFNAGVDPTDLVQARVTYSFIVLALVFGVFKRTALRIAPKDIFYFVILGLFGFALVQYTYFIAISKIDVGIALCLQYTAPTMIVLYSALFLGKKVGLPTIISVGLALVGCYLVIGAYNVAFEDLNWDGILWSLSSAVVFAFYTLYGEKGLKKYEPWTVFFYVVLCSTIFWNIAHPPLVLVGQGWSWTIWTGILAVAMLGTLIPFALFFMALKELDPIRLTVTSTLEPIFATIMAFLTLGEALDFVQIIGGVFIIASVILMAKRGG